MTVLKDKNILEVPFKNLTFNYEKKPTQHKLDNWTLKVYYKQKKTFQIKTNQDGFSQETIKNLAQQLKIIEEAYNNKKQAANR